LALKHPQSYFQYIILSNFRGAVHFALPFLFAIFGDIHKAGVVDTMRLYRKRQQIRWVQRGEVRSARRLIFGCGAAGGELTRRKRLILSNWQLGLMVARIRLMDVRAAAIFGGTTDKAVNLADRSVDLDLLGKENGGKTGRRMQNGEKGAAGSS
jgi:hypothetical protein